MSNNDILIRTARSSDHTVVMRVMDDWWAGRQLSGMLPRIFFIHFEETTFVAEKNGELVGFLAGILSQTYRNEAYIHFVGVHPDERKRGLARMMYESFFDVCRKHNRTVVRCCTSPVNAGSVSFHRAMGFLVEAGNGEEYGLPVILNYDGHGGAKVRFLKTLE